MTRLEIERLKIRSYSKSFAALGPERIMRSGFVYFTDSEENPVVSAGTLARGDVLKAHLMDGTASVTVKDIDLKEKMME